MRNITTSRDYWNEVVAYNKNAFFDKAANFATAVNLANSLFHFHEWLYETNKAEAEQYFNTTFSNCFAVWKRMEDINKKACYIRDFANATKHVIINKRPSTSMSHAANTHIIVAGFRSDSNHDNTSIEQLAFDVDGQMIPFHECASAVFEEWEKLVKTLP